jgi:hypothetical protein
MRLSVNIDRLVFHDKDMSEKRAGRIKDIVEVELRRRLMQSDGLNSITDGYQAHLAAEPLKTPMGNNEKLIARRLANQITGAITGEKG